MTGHAAERRYLVGIPQITYVSQLEIAGGVARAKLGCNSPWFSDFRGKRLAEKELKITLWNADNLGADPSKIGARFSYNCWWTA